MLAACDVGALEVASAFHCQPRQPRFIVAGMGKLLLLGLMALSAASASAQSDQPITTLKVTTRVVEVSAVVKTHSGEPQGGLTRDDFVLTQDGHPEPIRYFSQGSDLPLTIALMVDTSGSQRTLIGDETLASDVFFESVLGRVQDRAELVEFDNKIVRLRGLTSSPGALHLALLSLSPRAALVGGTLLNDAICSVARTDLAKETGRKAMVILTDGGDNGSRCSVAQAVEQAQRADVQVYAILYSDTTGQRQPRPGQLAAPDSGTAILRQLSENTGGRVFTASHTLSLREIFAQISQDLRLQYELGYTPPADTQPDTYHKLDVKTRDKHLQVQARKGFFARP